MATNSKHSIEENIEMIANIGTGEIVYSRTISPVPGKRP